MNVDYRKYAMFNYEQNPSKDDKFRLGDVVIQDDTNEVGVIIQCHGNNEYRTDMFGNCTYDPTGKYGNIQQASSINIIMNRPSLLN